MEMRRNESRMRQHDVVVFPSSALYGIEDLNSL